MDWSVVAAYIFGLFLLYLIARIFFLPVRILIQLVINGLVGGLVLYAINLVGGFFGFSMAINPITALTVGFLGLPGVALLFALQYLLTH